MVKGKCICCNKKAVAEYLILFKKSATTSKFCEKCKPKLFYDDIILIAGK